MLSLRSSTGKTTRTSDAKRTFTPHNHEADQRGGTGVGNTVDEGDGHRFLGSLKASSFPNVQGPSGRLPFHTPPAPVSPRALFLH